MFVCICVYMCDNNNIELLRYAARGRSGWYFLSVQQICFRCFYMRPALYLWWCPTWASATHSQPTCNVHHVECIHILRKQQEISCFCMDCFVRIRTLWVYSFPNSSYRTCTNKYINQPGKKYYFSLFSITLCGCAAVCVGDDQIQLFGFAASSADIAGFVLTSNAVSMGSRYVHTHRTRIMI